MLHEVVGYKLFDYKPKNGDGVIPSCRLYTVSEEKDVVGRIAQETFIKREDMADYIPAVGDVIQILYNRWGRAEGIVR